MANLKYVTHQGFGVFAFIGKNGLPASRDPDTGLPSAMNLLSDARQPTLETQAVEAAITHLQFDGRLDDQRLQRIVGKGERHDVAGTAELGRPSAARCHADGRCCGGVRATQ